MNPDTELPVNVNVNVITSFHSTEQRRQTGVCEGPILQTFHTSWLNHGTPSPMLTRIAHSALVPCGQRMEEVLLIVERAFPCALELLFSSVSAAIAERLPIS